MENQQPTIKSQKLDLIKLSREVLNGKDFNSKSLKELYLELEKMDQFSYASEVLLRKIRMDSESGIGTSVQEHQKLAKYIYKDHSLPATFKFDKALKELNACDDLNNSENCETFGLAGAIYKRKWQFDNQYKNLILSRFYYGKGFGLWKEFLNENKDLSSSNPKNDLGYNAINFAYANEQMAIDRLEEHGKITGLNSEITDRIEEAENVRNFILKSLLEKGDLKNPVLNEKICNKWTLATVAEAFFGLRQYDAALHYMNETLSCFRQDGDKVHDQSNAERENSDKMLTWEMRSFTQQIFALAYLQIFQKEFEFDSVEDTKKIQLPHAKEINEEKILRCLHLLKNFGRADKSTDKTTDIRKQGRLGLALSGGGFRASLFHIGVLASLAESDELRHVQVISTVSGGSIIGAFYFLKLKFLFETKHDDEIDKDDYIQIVREIESEFLTGVQQNLRMQIFSDFPSNWRMLTDPHYSRTHRLGELYEKHFYQKEFFDEEKYQTARVKMAENRFIDSSELDKSIDEIAATYIENYWERVVDRYEQNQAMLDANNGSIFMQNLFVNPFLNQDEAFDFKLDNWKRKNKIPQLVLNATSVNTGHNFQFTASWMGEPPMNIIQDIDVKPRLRRMYYSEAPDPYKNFRLGYAVGASSCVPVMFHPMPMRDLYEGIELQLVDGGLHDNQGISSLLEQECNQIIISDASGQLPTENVTSANELSLFYRSDSILQERLRELQFLDIKSRSNTTQIYKLTSIHLKNDLFNPPINWRFCEDPPRSLMYGNQMQSNANHLTKYGVLREIQLALAEIRTDLDAFHDKEAYALMYSGYVQMNHGMEKKHRTELLWKFGSIEPFVTRQEKAAEFKPLLMASKKIALKILDVNMTVRWIAWIFAGLLLFLLLYAGYLFWNTEILRYSLAVNGLLIIVGIYLIKSFSKHLGMIVNIKSEIRRRISIFFMMLFAFVISNLYLTLINPLYNQSGEMEPRKKKVKRPFNVIQYWKKVFPRRKNAV